ERHCRDDQKLAINQQYRWPDLKRERIPCAARVEEREHHANSHYHDVNQQSEVQTEILSKQELAAANRLRKNRIQSAPLDLFVNQADADKNRDESSKEQHRAQSQIDNDFCFLPGRQFADEDGAANQQQREKNQVIKDAIANCFAKRVASNRQGLPQHE